MIRDSAFIQATQRGYCYLRQDRPIIREGVVFSRFTKDADGRGPALLVGYDRKARKWVIEEES